MTGKLMSEIFATLYDRQGIDKQIIQSIRDM
jgi:hypothetical protein